jgi:ankyrin repeat protein
MVQIYKFTKYFLFCYLFNLGISNAADSFQEKFLEAAKKGDFEEVKALKALGAQLSYANEKGRTALHEAARGGHENI